MTCWLLLFATHGKNQPIKLFHLTALHKDDTWEFLVFLLYCIIRIKNLSNIPQFMAKFVISFGFEWYIN